MPNASTSTYCNTLNYKYSEKDTLLNQRYCLIKNWIITTYLSLGDKHKTSRLVLVPVEKATLHKLTELMMQ